MSQCLYFNEQVAYLAQKSAIGLTKQAFFQHVQMDITDVSFQQSPYKRSVIFTGLMYLLFKKFDTFTVQLYQCCTRKPSLSKKSRHFF